MSPIEIMALWYIKTKLHYSDMIAELYPLAIFLSGWSQSRLLSPSAEALVLWATRDRMRHVWMWTLLYLSG